MIIIQEDGADRIIGSQEDGADRIVGTQEDGANRIGIDHDTAN